ncbi:UDP-2,3-diacylglucosamine diphosphatase [Larsenimonas salina]|uniref:UDP-2,3-diacylglucosamine diphosphatase n=1 Tax=Larsenimonas salina TaxID=1295565 RepID=UPI0020736428|nr:UDP-2,3-diacylglucosamine diphosphatase [Larsenimonas salina]MCM5704723.1 UDP-2,3-diacylglucosamine diphosphatase [Larsenimonas salina]
MTLDTESVETLFISDLHMGTPDCQASRLISVLERINPSRIYLVGDIFDLIAMRRRAVLTPAQQQLISMLIERARTDCDMIYIPGNHDAAFRRLCGSEIFNIRIEQECFFTMKDGRKMLIAHGDEFDEQMHEAVAPWLHQLGSRMLNGLRVINRWITQTRERFNLPYWSLSAALKRHSERTKRYINVFETAAIERARTERTQGYMGGHIHLPSLREYNGYLYANCGDWVEHCTALVEMKDGQFHMVDYELTVLATAPFYEGNNAGSATPSRAHAVYESN